MLIYQINLPKRGFKSNLSAISLRPFYENIVLIEGCDADAVCLDEVSVDIDYMKLKYGFSLVKEEIACFISHKRAWEKFAISKADWCLIIEDDTIINCEVNSIGELISELPTEWDIFYPYNKLADPKKGSLTFGPYVLNFQWGAFAYFINKSALKKLLSLSCKQPVDDELIELLINNDLVGYRMETGYFAVDDTISYIKLARQNAIRDSILTTNRWTEPEKQLVRSILAALSDICEKVSISLVLDSGSLLGHIRHGEIIPWDDDVDLAIDRANLPEFLAQTRIHKLTLEFDKFTWINGGEYYKFWLAEGTLIEGHRHTFPFVDVWLYEKTQAHVLLSHGQQKNGDDYFPLKKVEFEGSTFSIPNNAQACLSAEYANWNTHLHIYSWSHREERSAHYPLSTEIIVDANGKLIL